LSRYYSLEDDLSFPDLQLAGSGWCQIDERRVHDRSRVTTELAERGDVRSHWLLFAWDLDVSRNWRRMAFVRCMQTPDGYWRWLEQRVSSWSSQPRVNLV
jgi:hypothetical protein